MNSTPAPKEALIARTDERLAHVHEQLARADEQLARVTEQLTKMERDSARSSSAGPRPRSPLRRPGLRALVGLPLAAFIVVATLVGGGARLVVARWAPQLISTPSLPPENPSFPAQSVPTTVQVSAVDAARPQVAPLAQATPQAAAPQPAAPQAAAPQAAAPQDAAPQDAAAPQEAAPTAASALPDHTQSQQTLERLANLERDIEQLKLNQRQMASDTSKTIEQLKANQEELKRVLAKVSEQNQPKTSPPPTQPTRILRKPERTRPLPLGRARHRIPREDDDDWYDYSDW